MKPDIRLLAVDIDGTLLDPTSELPAANLAALQRAHAKGVEVVLVTGRRYRFALPIAESLGFDSWLITSNGAIIRSLHGETFFRDLMPVETALRLCSAMDAFRRAAVVTFDVEGKGSLVVETTEGFDPGIRRWLERNRDSIDFVVPLEDALTTDPVQMAFAGSLDHMARAEAHLRSTTVESELTILRTRYPARDLSIMDVLRRDCSKGHTLERWARHRGLERSQVMAIGDNFNDVEMLEYAGLPVVMGNAAEEMKQNGWAITLANDQAGVAAAVEEFIG
ncbi:MAG TPA: Cof-type HAD-IIB family hydrolase [Terriglobales bacterium]|nr:Cof-type HAD-IIB family hydrolase [Terriglobales bacterium]